MLGKLIKNEFIQRGKPTFLIMGGILLYSFIECILHFLVEHNIIENDYFKMFVAMTSVFYVFVLFASGVGIILLMFLDFGKRLFKDQGYLTHTLPVKTKDIMSARIVFDLVAIVAMVIVYPLCMCIVTRNFDLYKELIDIVYQFLAMSGNGISKATITLDAILFVVAMFLSAIFSIWQYNAAYALGHSFTSSKRVMSVVFYIVIYTIMQIISGILVAIISIPSVNETIGRWISSEESEALLVLIMLLISNLVMFIGTFILIKITINVCKNKLNLE